MTKLLLKNKLTTGISLLLLMTLAPMQMEAQKRVLFICNSAFNPAGANYVATSSTVEADPLIEHLKGDPHFTVTTITTADGTTSVTKNGIADATALQVGGVAANSSPANIAAFYANYDLVITQESFGSGNAIWKPAGLLGIKNITIPVIYTKGYALRNGLALTDVSVLPLDPATNITATAVQGSRLTITVPPTNQSNPLFTGINFAGGNDIPIFKKLASDLGLADNATTSVKAVDQIYNVNITSSSIGDLINQKTTLLASIDPTATSATTTPPAIVNPNALACVNDIQGGTYFGTAGDMLPLTSHMMLFTFNYGAIALGFSDKITSNITADGLKIFKNAALILTGQTAALGVNENAIASNSPVVSPNPTHGIVTVNTTSTVKAITVFDTTGKQVATSKTNTVDLSNQSKGVYLVKVQTEKGSTTEKVIVE